MVHKVAGAFALGAALMLSTSAMAQDKRVVTYNADYDPIPLAGMEARVWVIDLVRAGQPLRLRFRF